MIKSFKDLTVYQKAFEQAVRIFEITKSFPRLEQRSLIDQIQRSSRSVCTNIGESWRKRRYVAHFVSGAPRAYARGTLHTLRRAQPSEAYHPSPRLRRIPSSHSSTGLHPWLSAKEGKKIRTGSMGRWKSLRSLSPPDMVSLI
jgi:hypothetical protein